ncbi:putative cyclin-dependent kinase protein [Botrytis fragariae]|uniref:Putative cyclin-dependent kinase protein n=1 Tax=Botrytis fragariae TaxID=1964551 RepID=A0A8H6ATZ3_9HELO|nr:putative cyclin-dependent kinase protein [Botrytis fragariae]KAF5873592.1 putative cyclin-dependent kinase protein [Botrytis fragariae]
MTSPKSSTTRRVLGDLNININTSVTDSNHERLSRDEWLWRDTKIQKVSFSNHPERVPLDPSQVVGHSTTKLQRENWEETNTSTGSRVANMEGAANQDNVYQGLEATTINGADISITERASLVSTKRRLSRTVQSQDVVSSRPGESRAKRRRIVPSSGNSSLLEESGAGVGLLPQSTSLQPTSSPARAGPEAKMCEERVGITDESSDLGSGQEQKMSLRSPQKQFSPNRSSISASSSLSSPSVVNAEDAAIISNNSQLTESIISNESSFIPTTISTPRTFRTSKSTSLSHEEIRQKSQALRLRLSLANYKVKTNQIDLPLSRLQVRSTSPKLPSLARLRRYSYGKSMGRTPLPGAPSTDTGREAVPAINIQAPGSTNQNAHVFVREKSRGREDGDENINIPSSPPLSGRESDSLSRRDSAISCTSFGSNSNSNSNSGSGSGLGHAHPLTPALNNISKSNPKFKETDTKIIINFEQEVARRKYEMIGDKENTKIRTPILERQKIGLANPPMIFAQPEEERNVCERGRSPELSRRAADGLVRLKLLR